jgi:tryptophan-rich sensory protein
MKTPTQKLEKKHHLSPTVNILVIIVTVATMIIGHFMSTAGMSWYYQTLKLPSITPDGWIIAIAWNIIFVCTALAAIFFWKYAQRTLLFWTTYLLLIINMILNGLWTYLFFVQHHILLSMIEAIALWIVTATIFYGMRRQTPLLSLLIIPYLAWLIFAILLNGMVWYLNH